MTLRVISICIACFFSIACSRPAGSSADKREPSPEPKKPVATRENRERPKVVEPPAQETIPEDSTPPAAAAETPEEIASLQQKFLNARNSDERQDIVHEIGELNTTQAMAVLGRLLQIEREADVKLDILGTIEGMEVENATKISILAGAVRPEQPEDVREFAIDALANLDEPGAVQILQGLTNDRNSAIRDAAKEALQSNMEGPQ